MASWMGGTLLTSSDITSKTRQHMAPESYLNVRSHWSDSTAVVEDIAIRAATAAIERLLPSMGTASASHLVARSSRRPGSRLRRNSAAVSEQTSCEGIVKPSKRGTRYSVARRWK